MSHLKAPRTLIIVMLVVVSACTRSDQDEHKGSEPVMRAFDETREWPAPTIAEHPASDTFAPRDPFEELHAYVAAKPDGAIYLVRAEVVSVRPEIRRISFGNGQPDAKTVKSVVTLKNAHDLCIGQATGDVTEFSFNGGLVEDEIAQGFSEQPNIQAGEESLFVLQSIDNELSLVRGNWDVYPAEANGFRNPFGSTISESQLMELCK